MVLSLSNNSSPLSWVFREENKGQAAGLFSVVCVTDRAAKAAVQLTARQYDFL
jgi:hypothetical protein